MSATPKVPVSDKRNILITSALPYVNNVPHLVFASVGKLNTDLSSGESDWLCTLG
jgi:hypothetical protein